MFYAAQIYRIDPSGTYDVYFPEDMEKLENVPARDIKHVKEPLPNWAKVSRQQFVSETFYHDKFLHGGTPAGPKVGKVGQFKVLGIGEAELANYYRCARKYKNGNLCKKELYFDMGYVQKRILRQIFPFDKTFA